MARYTGPVLPHLPALRREAVCSRASKCFTKCTLDKRPTPARPPPEPAAPQALRPRLAAAREAEGPLLYGVLEKQFVRLLRGRRAAARVSPARTSSGCSSCGSTTSSTRWASPTHRSRPASSSATATSCLNGRKTDIPSAATQARAMSSAGRPPGKKTEYFKIAKETCPARTSLVAQRRRGADDRTRAASPPAPHETPAPSTTAVIVEYYSR